MKKKILIAFGVMVLTAVLSVNVNLSKMNNQDNGVSMSELTSVSQAQAEGGGVICDCSALWNDGCKASYWGARCTTSDVCWVWNSNC